ncbi:hypothetical protein [Azospirillum canadense]|uniref:hypothetical protein n=1 Tax=Azospirillum canadense TaxID=403962 RepID=UPI002227EDB3|nr:hypothetical protein [Azospirillum canadense]MCW2240373.1 hypothetical protein [Azospirillum canadense]
MNITTIMTTAARKAQGSALVQAALYAALYSVPMAVMGASDPAHAAFKTWVDGRVNDFDIWSGNGPLIKAMFGFGAFGTAVSGWKLYEGMQDGGRVADNKGSVLGLGASMATLGLSGLIAALTPAAG